MSTSKFTPGLTFSLDLHDWMQSNVHQIRWIGKCGPTNIEWDSVLFTETENDEVRELIDRANLAPELYDVCRLLSSLAPSAEGLGGRAPIGAFLALAETARALLARIEGGSE